MATPSTTKITQFLSWRLLQCNLIKPWFVFSWHPHDYASKKLHHWYPLNYNIAKKQTSTLQRCQYLKLHFKETIFFTNLIPLPKEKQKKRKSKRKRKERSSYFNSWFPLHQKYMVPFYQAMIAWWTLPLEPNVTWQQQQQQKKQYHWSMWWARMAWSHHMNEYVYT